MFVALSESPRVVLASFKTRMIIAGQLADMPDLMKNMPVPLSRRQLEKYVTQDDSATFVG